MTPGRKQGGGCWTCRLRRKRCDSVRPVCGSCKNLEIVCYSGKDRPPWMDGGAGQKQMAEMIKEKIRQNARLRREKRFFTYEDQGVIMVMDPDDISPTDTASARASTVTSRATNTAVDYLRPADSIPPILSASSTRLTTPLSSIDQPQEAPSSLTTASLTSSPASFATRSSPNSLKPLGFAVPIQMQLGSVMIYLDYVFPFLFPFYQPALIETGRQWLLGLLCQNEVSFHIASSLSAYFFSLVAQNNETDTHDDCRALVRDKLFEQIDMAVRSLQDSVSTITRHGPQSPILDRVRIMEEITQLLVVEVTVRRNLDWKIHLKPALVLFDEILQNHGINHPKPSLTAILSALPSPFPMATPHHKSLPYTADQSALMFFISLLLFIDIVGSTSLETPPALRSYHSSLLSSHSGETCDVHLEAVLGCQNWALVAIGDISALCAWKRDAKRSGNFSVVQLVNFAAPISKALEDSLASLDVGAEASQPEKINVNRLQAYYSRHDKAIDDVTIVKITQIWAYAAKIYLSVTLSGWQTNSREIQTSVAMVLSLLQTIESPAQLRGLSWPICVAGCLALPNQEHAFRHVVGVMGQLSEFGTVSDALCIMEATWSSRDTMDRDVWDIASCLNIMGSPVILL